MVSVRPNQKSSATLCVPSHRQISKWGLLAGIFLILVLNSVWRDVPNVQADGTVTTKLAEEIIYPRPDGTKDYNLIKENTTSFQAFSFYVMGDTPVSCARIKICVPDCHFVKMFLPFRSSHRNLLTLCWILQYRDWQEERLKVQIAEMKQYVKKHPERNLQFTVHVGDTQKVATTNCKESAYMDTSALLRKG